MARKPTTQHEAEDVPVLDEAAELPPDVVGPVISDHPAPVGPVVGKKPLGVKEVIPFKWKLIGAASGAILTLFKSTEREEVDAQFDRLGKEGYYRDLKIVDIDEKIEQPKPTKKEAKAAAQQAKAVKAEKDKVEASKRRDAKASGKAALSSRAIIVKSIKPAAASAKTTGKRSAPAKSKSKKAKKR